MKTAVKDHSRESGPSGQESGQSDGKSYWPILTVILMVVGYAAYYLCRSNLSVTRSAIIADFPGMTKGDIGIATSVGTLMYALGKFIHGALADRIGGRELFLYGMVGAGLFTVFFGFSTGLPMFIVLWAGNRFVQSGGWVGMVKMTSRWFSHSHYGRVMGIISLSYLFGDFFSRLLLGGLLKAGLSWREVFFVSALVLAVIATPCVILLRNAPGERNLPEPLAGNRTLFQRDEPRNLPIRELLRTLFRSRGFWTVCALSFGFTFMRETFNEWTPTYLKEVGKMSDGDAGLASSLFPLFGGISVILIGFISDRTQRRSTWIATGLGVGTLGLALLALGTFESGIAIVALIALIGFVLIGPYSLLAGAISLDFGGKDASATACGWVDGIGYIGGILSGYVIAKVAESAGWGTAFGTLAAVSFISMIIALFYARSERQAA